MRRLGIALTSAIALTIGGLVGAPSQAANDDLPIVSGTVTLNGKPKSDAQMRFNRIGGYASEEMTDGLGKYTQRFLEAGTYTAFTWSMKDEFLTTYYGNTVREPDAKRFKIGSTSNLKINIAAKAGGAVKGKLVDHKGKPAKFREVRADAKSRFGGGRAVTDSKGYYVIKGLPADSYFVSAFESYGLGMYDGGFSNTVSVKVATNKTAKAKTIKFIKPRAVGKSTIKGKITGRKNFYKFNAAVTLISKTQYRHGYADAKGNVKVDKLDAGTYKVFLNGANTSKTVKVKKGKTASFGTFKRAKGTKISGTVKTSKNKALAKTYVYIYDANGTSLGGVATSSKGKYSIPGAVSGKYTVSLSLYESSDVSPAPKTVKIKKGKKATVNLKARKGAVIKGKVVTTKGKAIKGVNAFAYATGTGGGGYGSAVTNSKGEFKIKGLRPGSYKISFTDPYEGGYFNAFYGGKTLKSADNIKLKTGKTVKLKSKVKMRR